MYFAFIILLLGFSFPCFSQERYYSCGDDGELIESYSNNCSMRSLGNYLVFGDIAITPNGSFYGITDRLYKLDTVTQTTTVVSSQLISNTGGLGLIAVDNNVLLFDKQDSLFQYDLNTNTETLIGVVGYFCNGDFAFFENSLFMISDLNELIKIEIDFSNNTIVSVNNIGYLNSASASAYSLFTAFGSCTSKIKSLFIIDGTTVYEVNETNAQILVRCELTNQSVSYGTASYRDAQSNQQASAIPNVFTPNNDGVNDEYKIIATENINSFEIYNRWGNLIYCWKSGTIDWDGKDMSGAKATEGVYFYSIQLEQCGKAIKKTGHITLLR